MTLSKEQFLQILGGINMSNSKKLLSFLLAVVIIIMSVVSSGAIIISDDTVSPKVEWVYKIDKYLVEKMAEASDTDLIPVWVWMTDIDMEQLDKDIEAQTGISQQKLDTARAEIGYDVSTMSANVEDLMSTDANVQNTVTTYLDATKVQREKIANDTEVYLTAKKALASQRYATANTAKISQLGVSNNRIDFQSELTPSFIAFLTKAEIMETAQSSNVVQIGYFNEYDEESAPEPTQARAMAEEQEPTEPSTELPTLDVSTLHTGMKQALQHDLALDKYGVTGNGIQILHVDVDYVRSDHDNINKIADWKKINIVMQKSTLPITDYDKIPFPKHNSHGNYCASYIQSFAENVEIYSVIKQPTANELNVDINALEDLEYAITDLDIDLINSSCYLDELEYSSNFYAKWFDAIVATYNIPLVASAGNDPIGSYYNNVIAPANAYNSIAVGIYDYSNNKMLDNYTYNPISSENTVVDRVSYKPDLVVAMQQGGGTSAGAPTVSAIVAMMMELDPSLKGQPEIIKAILMASCHEKAQRSDADVTASIDQELMTDGLTLKQGAGKVNALRALNIVEYGTYGYGNINQTQNFTTAKRFSINSQVFNDATSGPPMNISVAWLRSNTKNIDEITGDAVITLGAYCDLDLKVQYIENGVSKEKSSAVNNAGKQLLYFPTTELDTQYSLKISWGENSTDNVTKKYGYAYSIGSFEKVLDKVEVTGVTGVGRTLTANAYTADALPVQDGTVTYRWHKSDDGESWQPISGETSSTYEITDAVLNKYIRCVVTQNYLNNYKVINVLPTKVILYGDVDNDGVVSVMDANTIQRYIDQAITLTDLQLLAADVNLDGVVSVIDATLIQNYLGKQIPYLPYTG